MKKLLASVLCLMLAVAFMAINTSVKAAVICSIVSYEELLEINRDKIIRLHIVPDAVFQKYLKNANIIRAASKLHTLEAKGMSVAEFKNGNVGTVLVDSNDCVVPGSMQAGKLEDMKERFVITDSVAIFDPVGGEV